MPKAPNTKVNWPPKTADMSPAPRPTAVTVGFMEYAIHWIDDKVWRGMDGVSNSNIGEHEGPKATIRIRLVPNVHEQYFRETLWHEIMHAVWFHCNLRDKPIGVDPVDEDDQEERIVSTTSFMFMHVIQENPGVMAYLSAGLYRKKVWG